MEMWERRKRIDFYKGGPGDTVNHSNPHPSTPAGPALFTEYTRRQRWPLHLKQPLEGHEGDLLSTGSIGHVSLQETGRAASHTDGNKAALQLKQDRREADGLHINRIQEEGAFHTDEMRTRRGARCHSSYRFDLCLYLYIIQTHNAV